MPLHQGYTTIDTVLQGLHLGKFVDQKFQALFQIELVFFSTESLLKSTTFSKSCMKRFHSYFNHLFYCHALNAML